MQFVTAVACHAKDAARYTILQRQKAESAHLQSKQVLPFNFAQQ